MAGCVALRVGAKLAQCKQTRLESGTRARDRAAQLAKQEAQWKLELAELREEFADEEV